MGGGGGRGGGGWACRVVAVAGEEEERMREVVFAGGDFVAGIDWGVVLAVSLMVVVEGWLGCHWGGEVVGVDC